MGLLVVGAVLLVFGVVAVPAGILPADELAPLAERVGPVLGFVVAITVVAELAADAGVFDRVAALAARLGRGSGWALWLLTVLLSVVSTIFLSLDTTAVLLTPIVVAMARRSGLDPVPYAVTTMWLANTASLLLPVSNLTNLLAASAMPNYVAISTAPAVVAIVVSVALLAVLFRTRIGGRYTPPALERSADRPLFAVAAIVVLALLPALVSGVPVWIPATAAAVVLIAVFAGRRPATLRPGLVPWSLLVFAAGLFLVITAASDAGLTTVLRAASGTGESSVDLLRLAGVGVAATNLTDNLPAFLALQPVAHSPVRLMTILVATNAGPLITPWASLATLLWRERIASAGLVIPWPKLGAAGLLGAVLTVGASTAVLALLH